MATATSKILLGCNMKLLFSGGNKPLLGGNKNLVREFLLRGGDFSWGADE